MKTNSRIQGLDILKTMATVYVIILHVIGYYTQYVERISGSQEVICIVMEAIAYPAIHIFVLIGSYLMARQREIKWKNVLTIYLLTLFVTVIGLIFMMAFDRSSVTSTGMLQCVLPFSTRAYGYVSSYIILILLSPFINLFMDALGHRKQLICISIWGLVVIILPTLFYGIWANDYMSLFVFLYLVASYAWKHDNFFSAKRGFCIWLFCTVVLIFSYYIFPYLGFLKSFVSDRRYFYHYNSIFVTGSAIGLFMALAKLKWGNRVINAIATTSLFVYLYHMHPVIKNCYNRWELFAPLKEKSGWLFFIMIMLLTLVILVVGVVLGYPLTKGCRCISNKICKYVKVKVGQNNE